MRECASVFRRDSATCVSIEVTQRIRETGDAEEKGASTVGVRALRRKKMDSIKRGGLAFGTELQKTEPDLVAALFS